jgi:winged helix DNA-binding protein
VITNRALNRATLARQLLLERHKIGIVAAVERLAGLQAQVPKPPAIGLWTRVAKFTLDDYRDALAKRELVRGTLMRGTLHIVSRRDFIAWRPAIQPVLTTAADAITRSGGTLDLDALLKSARKFLGKKSAIFEDIRQHLISEFPQYNDRLMGYAVRMHLPLAMMPDQSPYAYPTNSEFAVAESFLGEKISKEDSAHDLALHYLAAFGPATPADFQTWSGLKGGKPLFEELRPKLVTFRDEKKRELFDLPNAPRPDEGIESPVRFLPEFDNLLLAHAERTRIISDEHKPRVVTKNLRILATFLVDGVVAGTWTIEKKKLVLEPFGKLTKKVNDALLAEGEPLVKMFTK